MILKPNTEIVVPWSVLRRAGFKAGDRVEITARPGMITIRESPTTSEQTKTARTKKTHRAIDRGIAASEKDYKEGRSYGPFKTHEEFTASLNEEGAKLRAKKRTR